jgi:hypothetical protein
LVLSPSLVMSREEPQHAVAAVRSMLQRMDPRGEIAPAG